MRSSTIVFVWLFLVLLSISTFANPTYGFTKEVALNRPHPRPRISSAHLDRRGSKHLGNGWWMHYDTWTSILPWQVAAEGIDLFFQTILEKARSEWLSQEPQHYLKVAKGGIRIEFFSELLPIDWDFIARYAETMNRALDLGFAGMFDMRIVAPTGMVVYIHLRVRQAHLAAGAA